MAWRGGEVNRAGAADGSRARRARRASDAKVERIRAAGAERKCFPVLKKKRWRAARQPTRAPRREVSARCPDPRGDTPRRASGSVRLARAMGEKRRDGDSSSKKEKKSKRDADGAEDAAARAERKAAKRAKKDGGGGDGAADDGSVARVRVSGIPPGADAAKIAKFLGVDASKVVVLSGEATAIMPDAAAAKRAAADLDETKFAGRFVRVARDDFRPEDVATAPPARDAAADDDADDDAPVDRDRRDGGRGEVVEVECAGQTGRIIGKGGSKIREIEQLTGCVLRIRQEEGICEVTGRDVKAAVQEIKNIVEEGRERDGGGARDGFGARNFGADFGDDGRASGFPGFPGVSGFDPNRHAPSTARPFGMPPPGSASRNDTGANDWTCACGSVNFARRASCFRCAAPRDAARSEEFRGEAPASRRSIPSVPSVPSVPDTAATKAPTQGNDGDGYEVFVKYLPHSSEERDVAEFFSQFGPLRGDVRLLRHPATGQCKGAGFVTFAAEHSRDAALAKDGVKFGGRHLSITVAKTGTFGVRGTDQAAGTHTPAMLSETIRALVAPDPNGTYVDGTFGRGGHTRGILSALGPKGRLHAFDMDPEVRREIREISRPVPVSSFRRFVVSSSPALLRLGTFSATGFPTRPLVGADAMRRNTEPKKLSRIVVTHAVDHLITHRNRASRVAQPGRPTRDEHTETNDANRARGEGDERATRDIAATSREAFSADLSPTSPRRPSPRRRNWRMRIRGSRFTTRRSGVWTPCWVRSAFVPPGCFSTSASAARSSTTRRAGSGRNRTVPSTCVSTSRAANRRRRFFSASIATNSCASSRNTARRPIPSPRVASRTRWCWRERSEPSRRRRRRSRRSLPPPRGKNIKPCTPRNSRSRRCGYTSTRNSTRCDEGCARPRR